MDPDFNAYSIRNIFLELMIALMKDYSRYFIEEEKSEEEDQRKSLKKYYDM